VRTMACGPWSIGYGLGLSKGRAKIDICMKDISPISALCRWFGHEASKPSRWNEFRTELLEGAR
jgi:uncharacterized protein YeaO (DUF488 family)